MSHSSTFTMVQTAIRAPFGSFHGVRREMGEYGKRSRGRRMLTSWRCHSELPMPRYLGAPPGHENADPRSGTLESARGGPNVRGSARSGAASPFPRLNPGAPEAPPTVAIEHAEQTL